MKKFREAVASIIILIGALMVFGLWKSSIVGAAIVGIIFLILAGVTLPPSKCQICGNQIKQKYFKWKIEGEKKYACPKCNSALERKRSKTAISNL